MAAVDDGASIANMSVGFIENDCAQNCSDLATLRTLVERTNRYLSQGIRHDTQNKVLWVISAGNEGRPRKSSHRQAFLFSTPI